MRAAFYDSTDVGIRVGEVPDPVPGPSQLLVRVQAAGLNRADLLARTAGRRAAPSPAAGPVAAGAELAGEVVGVGADVEGWQLGNRVMGRGRGYAELATVEAPTAMRVPAGLTWEEAGGLPIALLTMHDALRTNGGLAPGKSVLINAATSGVGVTGVQLAALLGASVVVATSRSTKKLEILRDYVEPLGCPLVTVASDDDDVAACALEATAGKGVDVLIDNVGGTAVAINLAATAIRGTVVQVGRLGGRTDTIDLDELARKRISIVGVTFRTRTEGEVAEIVHRCMHDVGADLERCRPRVDRVFPLAEAATAQDALAENAHVGKFVLVP